MSNITWFLIGVGFACVIIYIAWIVISDLKRTKQITIDDPTNDEDYIKTYRSLKCPDCGSINFRKAEVCDLPWIKGEDTYCICNDCGRQFGDGK